MLVLVQALMASLAIVGKLVMREIPPGVLILARVCGAATVLAVAHRALRLEPVRDRADLRALALMGLLGVSANQSLFLLGLRHTTAVNATILVTMVPVFTVLGSLLFRRESPSAPKVLGILLAGSAAVYLIGPDRVSLAPGLALGNAMIVVAMMAYAAYLVLVRRMLDRYSAITVSYYVMLFGAIGVLPAGLYALHRMGPVHATSWLLVGYIVLFPTILAYFLNIWALKRASSNLVAGFTYLQPVFTAAVAPLLLEGEKVTARAAIAALGIFIGLALVIWGERRERSEVPVASMVGE
ncbi:MAG TPA: DMT family transporter [Gemmatimonadales bacterium]|nr:DMT family transporter [Gemmatimonadales bacterium]